MPVDIDFHLPFPAPCTAPQAVERARARGVEWACELGLLPRTEQAADYFLSLRLDDVATGFGPGARGADLDVMTDVITWTAICDDFFDGTAGDHPDTARAAVAALSASVGDRPPGPAGRHPAGPLAEATADLWGRMARPMSPSWQVRARANWHRFLRSFLAEAEARHEGSVPTTAEYFALRRETMAMYVYLDAAERAGRYEVPDQVLASAPVRELARLQIEILACCNDVHSVEHEQARGDTHNLVLVLERREGLDRAAAIERIRRWVHERSTRFLRVADGIPALCERMGLGAAEQGVTDRHVLAMQHQLRVTYDWSAATSRYSAQGARAGVPARRPRYLTIV
ncbi:terpene synthase family protein [Kitasatospora sp. NPDC017646]|uniref:terpene synthase family protein n=1 Tax=Kitasatospora sp. NPDC017646 TaxID=3364024 RepID=UPI0037B13539